MRDGSKREWAKPTRSTARLYGKEYKIDIDKLSYKTYNIDKLKKGATTMKLYRLIYTDGTHGAWTRDLEYIKRNAHYFRAKIETKEFPLVK